MEWIIAYFAFGVVVCIWSYRVAKRNRVDGPSGLPLEIPLNLEGIIFIAIAMIALWPIVLPLWVWLEIGAKKIREEEKERELQEQEMMKANPHYGLSMDEQIDKLREIHNQLDKSGENQAG